MAVYTVLDRKFAVNLAENYGLGRVTKLTGVSAGSVNTYYLLETTKGKFFIRIDEVKSPARARRELDLLLTLRAHGFRCPQPLVDRQKQLLSIYHGKPVSLYYPLPGKQLLESQLSPRHLEHVGATLASLHLLSPSLPQGEENRFDSHRVLLLYQGIRNKLPSYFKQVLHTLDDEVVYLQQYQEDRLPRGLIHGDVFADNLRFRGERVVGLLDFDAACHGKFLYDIATAINALCYRDDHYLIECFESFLSGYQRLRSLSLAEWDAFPTELRFSAFRFTVTRLKDFFLRPMNGGIRVEKDFREFLERLQVLRRERPGGMDRLLLALATGYDYRQYQKIPGQAEKPEGRKRNDSQRTGSRKRPATAERRKTDKRVRTAH